MRKLFPMVIVIAFVFFACKKNGTEDLLVGMWVEKTLKLDTLDFNASGMGPGNVFLNSPPYRDSVLNSVNLVTHATIYSYILNKDTLMLRNFLSSSTYYGAYAISFSTNTAFSISKFYARRALPPVIEFERIR